jgi:hypothetical protein
MAGPIERYERMEGGGEESNDIPGCPSPLNLFGESFSGGDRIIV